MRRLLPLLALPLAFCRADPLWIEGEAPSQSAMSRHPWWYDQVKKDQLSGGDWLSHFDDKKPGWAEYAFTLAEGGPRTLWLRANPVQAKLEWRVDDAAFQAVDFNGVLQQANLAADNKPDLRFIAWVKAGVVNLPAGPHTLRLETRGGPSNHAGIDCLVLADASFRPQGIRKPRAEGPAGPADWFAYVPGDDPFSPESATDVSATLPAPAGKFGRVVSVGADLKYRSTGATAKFWGCGANLDLSTGTREDRIRRVKYLRKHGVNLVRQHPLFDEVATGGRIDPAKLAEYDAWFAELKRSGIHTQWSVFYHFPVSAADGLPDPLFRELEPLGKDGLRDSYGLIQVSPALWAARTRVLTELLQHRNPHTGLRYAEDPALVTVEMQNEDCIFFWNPLGALAEGKKWPEHSRLLRSAFAEWARGRYPDAAARAAAWGKPRPGDSDVELEIAGPWELDVNGPRGKWAGLAKRAGDYIRFLHEHQTALYKDCRDAIRATGFDGVVVTTNWLAGSPVADTANMLADTVGDLIDRHNYAGGGAGGHGIHEGQIYADSHLGKPGADLFAIALKQVEDRPFGLSEWTMCPPNQWKAEAAPILAFYGMGLQGWDVSLHFAQSGTGPGDGWPGLRSYATDTPHYMGQFPALSLAVRMGHLREAPLVAGRRVTPEALFSGKAPVVQDYYDGKGWIRPEGGTPREAFAIGRVSVGFGDQPSLAADLTPHWDREARVLRALTGELEWDYGRERILVRAPKTQGVVGRAGDGIIDLPAFRLSNVRTPFVSLLFTALDDQPLSASRRVLITAMARDRQTGAEYSADGTQLLKVGTPPLLLEPVQATVLPLGGAPVSVRALDPHGVPKGAPLAIGQDGAFRLDGTHRACAYELRR